MPNPIDAAAIRVAHRAIINASDSVGLLMTREEKRELLLVDILDGLKHHQRVSGFAGEYLQERARIQGTDFDPRCPTVPWSLLNRTWPSIK